MDEVYAKKYAAQREAERNAAERQAREKEERERTQVQVHRVRSGVRPTTDTVSAFSQARGMTYYHKALAKAMEENPSRWDFWQWNCLTEKPLRPEERNEIHGYGIKLRRRA